MIKKSNKILSLMILIGLMSYCITTQAADDTITINPGNGTIQEAIDNANIGGTILLENGTYNGTGNYNITVNKTVTIKAAPNNDTPIINAEGQGRIFNITANNVILNGLTITGGNNTYGGAIHNTGANSSVSNTSFINNTVTDYGGAIYNLGANFSASGNVSFINNTATAGAAISNNGGVNFSVSRDVSFINNTATTYGGHTTYGGAIYNTVANFSVSNTSFINNTSDDYGGAIYNLGTNSSLSNTSCINNTANAAGAICNNGANFNVIGCDIVGNNNTNLNNAAILNRVDGANFSVIGCDIVGNIGGAIFNQAIAANAINYNRIVNNTNYGLYNSGGINADCNWWGTNNITNVGITGVFPNSYLVIQLSVNGNYTRNNTTMSDLVAPVTLTYNMVLNNTNNSENNSKLPEFNTTIKLTGSNVESINAKKSWNTTLNNSGEYNFTAICDNEDLNINLTTLDHPRYDLSLRNEPSGQVYVGTYIHSIATAIGGVPLSDDYCMFRITSPSGNIHEETGVFGVNDWVDCWWQITEKGQYLVEVWAYDKDDNHVKVPGITSQLFKPNVMKPFMEYSTYGDFIFKVQSNALEVINVE